jgi:S1-C subfamily serine protease
LTVKAITQQMAVENQLTDTVGVFVTGVKRVGPADLGGVRPGDVITSINKKPVVSLPDLMSRYSDLAESGTDKVLLKIDRNGAVRLAVLNVETKDEKTDEKS